MNQFSRFLCYKETALGIILGRYADVIPIYLEIAISDFSNSYFEMNANQLYFVRRNTSSAGI